MKLYSAIIKQRTGRALTSSTGFKVTASFSRGEVPAQMCSIAGYSCMIGERWVVQAGLVIETWLTD